MQITVDIPDNLAAQVKARGLSPEEYVKRLLEDAVRTAPPSADPSGPKRDMEAFFRDMGANSDNMPILPDEAFTRESFYQDHD